MKVSQISRYNHIGESVDGQLQNEIIVGIDGQRPIASVNLYCFRSFFQGFDQYNDIFL